MASVPAVSLRHWLESILLPQYLDVLTDSGYDTLPKCAVLTSADLDRIGISLPGHKKRFLSQLAKFDPEPQCDSIESRESVPVEAAVTDSSLVNLSNFSLFVKIANSVTWRKLTLQSLLKL